MARDRAIVGRLHFSEEGTILPPQYLCFDPALLAEVEWYWSDERAKAFVFEHHSEADARARALTADGVRFCHAAVLGSDQLAEERESRHADRVAGIESSAQRFRVSPEESFSNLEKRHLA